MIFLFPKQSHHSGEPAGDPGGVSDGCRALLCPGSQWEEWGEQDQSLHSSQRDTWVPKLWGMCWHTEAAARTHKGCPNKRPRYQRIGPLKEVNVSFLVWSTLNSLCKRGTCERRCPPQIILKALCLVLYFARQVHDDIPQCLLWSCGYNFFLMQVFIMCCFALCLSKQVILLSANLFMNLFPVYGIIFTWSYHRVPGNMHFIVITYFTLHGLY